MTWPDPRPNTDDEVRKLRITSPYDRYLQNRVAIIAELFERDSHSIDAIALSSISLSVIAELRYSSEVPKNGKNQVCFRRLLTEHCHSFKNRVSIVELLRAVRRIPECTAWEAIVKSKYIIETGYMVRSVNEDPLVDEFREWARGQSPSFPSRLYSYDYAACIFRHYRNAVLHELSVANGREAAFFGENLDDGPIYYVNGPDDSDLSKGVLQRFLEADPVEYIRFGIYPPYLLDLLREAISSLRHWALENDRNIFERDTGK